MPDGDIIRLGILPTFAKAYKQLCEESGSSDEWAREAVRGVRFSISNYGPNPIGIMKSLAKDFSKVLSSSFQPTSQTWINLDLHIGRIQQHVQGRREPIDLAIKSCRIVLTELERGFRPKDILSEITQVFVVQVYNVRFRARAEAAPVHWDDVNATIVRDRLDQMEPEVKRLLRSFASQIRNEHKLKLSPRRGPKRKVDGNTNVL